MNPSEPIATLPSGVRLEHGVAITAPEWLEGGALATVVQRADLSALHWLLAHKTSMADILRSRGAVLLRGFAPITVDEFESIATVVGGPPQPYENRSTPRRTVKGNILTSTEYPASELIPIHNENSYSTSWPRHILFLCMQPASSGGATPIADSSRVYASISPSTRGVFESKGVMYLRNYGDLGLSWQETFQTQRKEDVEAYCRRHDMQFEWIGSGLRTRQVLPATRAHSVTGAPLWFNQAHLFHVSSLGCVAKQLLEICEPQRLPRHALFGDGSEIPESLLDEIRAVYDSHAVPVSWARNDLLILDNMWWGHGRHAFVGPRRVVVAMSGQITGSALELAASIRGPLSC